MGRRMEGGALPESTKPGAGTVRIRGGGTGRRMGGEGRGGEGEGVAMMLEMMIVLYKMTTKLW